MSNHRIRALYDEQTIRVYQAYNEQIADEAVMLGTFGQAFKRERMTWIKPSYLWMMYRSGWAEKEGQQRVLAIDINRDGFDLIVRSAVPSSFLESGYESYGAWQQLLQTSEARCQWDPDRDIYGNPLNRRAIQLGIKGGLVDRYVTEWITKITDITAYIIDLRKAITAGTFADSMLPAEREYPLLIPG